LDGWANRFIIGLEIVSAIVCAIARRVSICHAQVAVNIWIQIGLGIVRTIIDVGTRWIHARVVGVEQLSAVVGNEVVPDYIFVFCPIQFVGADFIIVISGLQI